MTVTAVSSATIAAEFRKLYLPVSAAATRLSVPGDRWDAQRVYRALEKGLLQGLDSPRLVLVSSIEKYERQRAAEREVAV